MKVHKISLITISTVSLTFLILTIQKIEFNKIKELRHLSLDEKKVDEICKKGPERVSNYYLNADAKIKSVDSSRYFGEHVDILIELIDGNTENLIKYAMRLLPFVVFIVFAIFSIFGWLFCCCCCCCPCCCCNQTKKNQYLCRLVSFIVSMALFLLIVILSLYGFFGLKNIMKGLNGMSCTIFKLYLELINGQSIEKTPKWTGVNGISDTLTEIRETVNTIVEDKENIFKSKDTFNRQKTDFQDELKTPKYTNEIDALKIEYNDPTTSQKIQVTPDYVTIYKPVDRSGTSLNLINYEFETVVDEADKLLNDASNQADSIVSSASTFTSSIDSINSIIADFNTNLDDFSRTAAEPWMDYQNMITNYGTLACNCFFGVLAGFGIVVIVLTTVYVICRVKCTKIFINIIWNILALVMILSFIIGAIFGLLGVIGKDGSSVIYFLISAENLQTEEPKIIPGSISSKIDICLHGTGDLSSEFDTSSMNNLTQLDKIKGDLELVKSNLTQHKNSITISNLNTNLDEIKINFDDASKKTQFLTNLIKDLNRKTNSGTNCGNDKLYDKWVINKDECDRTNPYAEERGPLGSHNCLIFSDKTTDLNRYGSCNPSLDDINKYLEAIHEYKETNANCIDEIKKRNNELNKKFTGVIEQLIKTIDDVDEKLLNKVSELSNSITGNSEDNIINTLVNCAFLKGHVRMVYENLYDGLGANFYSFGIIMEVISSSIALGICFLIPVLNRYNKTYPEDRKETIEEDKSPLKPIANKEPAPTGAFTEPEVIQINKKGAKPQSKFFEKGTVIVQEIK